MSSGSSAPTARVVAGSAMAVWCLAKAGSAATGSAAFAAPVAAPAGLGQSVGAPAAAALPAARAAPVAAASGRVEGGFLAAGAAFGLMAMGGAAKASGRGAKGVATAGRGRAVSAVAMHARGGGPICAGVVITGGAAGVGWAYADEFLARGHRVVICDVKDPTAAVEALKRKHPNGSIYGTVCDVGSLESVNKFIDFVKEKIRVVHYWINNAGINGGRRRFTEIDSETIEAVVKVNLGGILLCTHAAMKMMEQQQGVTSHIFNTVGSGVKGGGTPGYVAYGATKRGLPQMTDSLVKEIEEGVQGYDKVETPGKVNAHVLSPGMVFTDLLLNDSTPELRKFPFGVLAAQPEEVGKDLVPKILNVGKNGSSVEFLTTDKILTKFFQRFILGQKSEYIDDDGNVIKTPGAQYQDNGVRALY